MKMSDVFDLPVSRGGFWSKLSSPVRPLTAASHAINCHDDLVEALELAKEWLSTWASAERELAIINAALAKARGEA